jgi:hypothetical protein
MKIRYRLLLPALCFLTVLPSLQSAGTDDSAKPDIPASLSVPPSQGLLLTLTARGVQIYECRPTLIDPGKFEWAFKAPEADLFSANGQKVGRHYAGPTWELADGDKVVGKLKAKADSPGGKGVPWLLLDATAHSGTGVMSRVQSIQRVDTVGGNPPAEPAEKALAGNERRVEYTATYRFYGAKP